MKRLTISFGLLMFFTLTNLVFAGSSGITNIVSIESRESGYHAVYISGTMPDEGCTLLDRGILIASTPGAESMFNVAMAALDKQNSVLIRVDGCTIIEPVQPEHTAPHIRKIHIYP
uniref:Uncharacterized protein n=1 Tax=Candidatus Kentrum sp. MB TaxID=2138164 RepID=A0A450XUV2_9GAMM|nr:MAG: hypothetical protein BECKMB1821G_GA0114241_11359 [Candidatus Kentron sp. MB]VFK35646.1 MAG: hypothetical protein BECKMB1821I_GA0114274_113410 [Candidatus Kentron sp. MB]VFK77483.1 MAG: hypothetical protein BECKMB1821H_GA0114242_11459 [Candidatus Kentron sp. MB]